mgnify:CR=1 FL=1
MKRRATLTAKQARILAFIKRHIKKHKYPPTVREISDHYGLWWSGCDQHLALIERKGYLRRIPNTARGIVPV